MWKVDEMSTISIYRWSGEYFGFLNGNKFYDSNGKYLGWADDESRIWSSDGWFFGQIVNNNYVLRRVRMKEPKPRIPIAPSLPPVPPIPNIDQVPRAPKPGWRDALDEYT